MEIFSARAKWLREKLGMSQKEVAELVGMTPAGYGKIENGQREPSLEKLVQISTSLNESSDFLLGMVHYDNLTKRKIDRLMELFGRAHGIRAALDDYLKKPFNDELNSDFYSKNLRYLEETINRFEDGKMNIIESLQSIPYVPESFIDKYRKMNPQQKDPQ